MKYGLLLTSVFILSLQLGNKSFFYRAKSFIKLPINQSKELTGQNFLLYRATITGNKKGIDKEVKSLLDRYGLNHLLTPSGLHLSTLMPILLIPTSLQLALLFFFLIWISSFGSYQSLERVILFAIVVRTAKVFKVKISIEKAFIICMLMSLLSGNISDSPWSFLYSFLFWGTIVIFRDNPIRMIIFMNLSLQFISILNGSSCALSSIIINPVMGFSYVCMFPIFILNLLMGGVAWIESIISIFLTTWIGCLHWINNFEVNLKIEFSFLVIIAFILFALQRHWKKAIMILLLNVPNAGTNLIVVKYPGAKIYNEYCRPIHFGLKCKKKALTLRATN